MSLHARKRARRTALAALALAALIAGCGGARPEAPIARTWWIGRALPSWDPLGPREPVRDALQRLVSRPLVDFDSLGGVTAAGAASFASDSAGLRWTFRLRDSLASAADYQRTLLAALERTDHGLARWTLAAVRGVDAVRPRRPLPAIGIAAADARTLVFRLVRPDERLPEKLAASGLAFAWTSDSLGGDWSAARGSGSWRIAREEPGRLVLLRSRASRAATIVDTLVVRSGIGAGRARAVLRAGRADVVWPLPPGLASERPPAGYALGRTPARPARHLVLVLRADTPPMTRLPARQALLHALEWPELTKSLEPVGSPPRDWLGSGGLAEPPRFDRRETAAWLERGKLGSSIHPVLAYDADGAGAEVARLMQGQASRVGLYLDLAPLRGAEWPREALGGWRAQALLVETQPPIEGAEGEVARWVQPARGAAAGGFRPGWRPADIPAWDRAQRAAPSLDLLRGRIADEGLATPLSSLDWVWVVRAGGFLPVNARNGPDFEAWLRADSDRVRR